MTPEEKRIKIAEACEWTDIHGGPPHGVCWRGANPLNPNGLKEEIPDYFNDLNAMHEAEKVLSKEQRADYIENVIKWEKDLDAIGFYGAWFIVIQLSASDRAEAFGKTLNLW